MTTAGDWAKLRTELLQQGFRIVALNSSHWQAIPADARKTIVTFSDSTADSRAFKNTLARLRASGFVWPPPPKAGASAEPDLVRCPNCLQNQFNTVTAQCASCDTSTPPDPAPGPGDITGPAEAPLDRAWKEVKAAREANILANWELNEATTLAHEAEQRRLACLERANEALERFKDSQRHLQSLLEGTEV